MSFSFLRLISRFRSRGPMALLIFSICFSHSFQPRSAASAKETASTTSDSGLQELRALVLNSAGKPAAAELLRLESKYKRQRAGALARFLRGYLFFGGGAYTEAADALNQRVIGESSALGDHALFYRAESEAGLGSARDAARDYSRVGEQYPDSLLSHDATIKGAEILIQLGDPKKAIDVLKPMSDAMDGEAMYLIASAIEKLGDTGSAVKLYRAVYFKRPATRSSDRVIERLTALNADPAEQPGSFEEETSRADAFFDAKQFAESARAYDRVIALFKPAATNDAISLRLGISLLNNKQPVLAAPPLSRVSEKNAGAHAEALYQQAEAFLRAEQSGPSTVITDQLIARHPKSKWAESALYSLANYLNKKGRAAEALVRFRQLLANFPNGEYAPEATYSLGWHAYKTRQFSDASRMLEQHLAKYRYPSSKFLGEAGLWAAKSEELTGAKSRALALYDLVAERYRYGYHGYIAGRRAAALRAANPALKPEEAKPGSELGRIKENLLYVDKVQENWNAADSRRVDRADDLEIIGLTDLAVRELNDELKAFPSSPKLNLRLAQTYARRGDTFQATLILRRGYPDLYSYRESDLPREAWEVFFPLRNWDAIKQEARRYGVDPYVAAGLIRQESVFNPNAISRVGARGLMQLMPGTAQLIAKRQGGDKITTADLYNPVLNIKLGMGYLADMMGQFGRVEYAAAAYNAGPGRAKQWIAERGSSDIEDWIESIPFTETRAYVQGVLRYAANYRRLYKD